MNIINKILLEAKEDDFFKPRKIEPRISQAKEDSKIEIEAIKNALKLLVGCHRGDEPLGDYSSGSRLMVYLKQIKTGIYSDDTSGVIKRKLYARKRELTDMFLTPEEKEAREAKKSASEEKAWKKKVAERNVKHKEEKQRLGGLDERQKAINTLVDKQYHIRMLQTGYGAKHPQTKKYIAGIKKEIDTIKQQYNIKSYEIKRQ